MSDGTSKGEDERRSARAKMSEGIRQGIGVLSAFRDALEETIHEARERGDLSSDRAKEVMKEALDKAHAAAEEARGRLDVVPQREFDRLGRTVAEMRGRLAALEIHVFGEVTTEGGGTEEAGNPTREATDALDTEPRDADGSAPDEGGEEVRI